MDSKIIQAAQFARKAHQGQFRKVSGMPYIVHPARVAARILILPGGSNYPNHNELVIAAFLHDVPEDTSISLEEIKSVFGEEVHRLVSGLTNQYSKHQYPQLSRKERKRLENDRLAALPTDTKLIKLVDRIDNLCDMQPDDNFLPVYLAESRDLAKFLDHDVVPLYFADFYSLLDELQTTIEKWELRLS